MQYNLGTWLYCKMIKKILGTRTTKQLQLDKHHISVKVNLAHHAEFTKIRQYKKKIKAELQKYCSGLLTHC